MHGFKNSIVLDLAGLSVIYLTPCGTEKKIKKSRPIRSANKGGIIMSRKHECIAMLLAGGQGSRLGILTKTLQNLPFLTAENTELSISLFQTA